MSSGDEANDSNFVPPISHRGKGHMVETGGSQGASRTKHKAKRKIAPTPRPSSGEDEDDEYEEFSHEAVLSVVIPTLFPMLI
jgi:hypothetical protein